MLKIGQIGDLKVYLEQVPPTEQPAIHSQLGVSCLVRMVKGPNTLFTVADAIEYKFCFGDLLEVFERTDKNEVGRHFHPGHENYCFHGQGFCSNGEGQFVLAYIIRPVQASFE